MTELWEHQKEAIKRALPLDFYGLFLETGTGKSRTLIEILRAIYARHERQIPTLIISPVVTLNNWKNEICKYSKITDKAICVLQGDGKKKVRQLIDGVSKNKIIVTNYESLLNEELFQLLFDYLRDKASVLVCDESHYAKNPTAKRTKKILSLSEASKFRYVLSATPILNSPEDIWSQAYILDHGERFEKKFHHFKLKYFEDRNRHMPKAKYFPNWQIKKDALVVFEAKLAEISMSVKKEECLDLPPFVKTEIEVELSAGQKKHYESVKKDFISYVSNEVACVASIAIVKALRMQEISSGYISLDNDELIEFTDNPRLDALEDLVKLHTPNHKIIIWSCFKQNHQMIAKMLRKNKIEFVFLTGAESQQQKFDNMDSFEKDPKVRVCIGSQSVGIGISLLESSMSIYYSRNFNLGHDIQSEARNYRAGSERHKSIYRIDLVAKDTLDKDVLSALADKKSIGAKILRDFVVKNI